MLRAGTRVDAPLERVFEFFSLAENLERLTPKELSFTILTPRPIEMRVGTLIDYRIRLGLVPMRWRTRIDVWEPGRRFVDAQLSGPYACWWHEHRFVADGGATKMFDTVFYSPPLGPLGAVANALIVKPKLTRIFAFRETAIAELFRGDGVRSR
ncbi:MAG: SRPBCC family protein [Planctomycetes bacterium]|nr:SRPBCC family protein [Planctomycetota bacterium]